MCHPLPAAGSDAGVAAGSIKPGACLPLQPLVPQGAKFNLAVAFEKAGTSDGHLGLHFVYGSLHVAFKDELIVDNAIYCLCLKASLESKTVPI